MYRLILILIFTTIVGSFSWIVQEIYFTTLVLGTGIPHIILGAKYSKRGLQNAFNNYWNKILILLFLPLSLILGFRFGAVGLIFYFAVHHAISETYSHKSLFQNNGLFNLAYGTLVGSSFLIACRNDFIEYNFLFFWCYLLFFASAVTLIIFIKKHYFKINSVKELLQTHPWLLGAPALCILTIFNPISWLVIILYHYVFWGFLPLFRSDMFQGDKSKLKTFWKDAIKWNGLGIIGIGLLVFISIKQIDFRLFQLILLAFYIANYWHISVSFVISGANPQFVRRLFVR